MNLKETAGRAGITLLFTIGGGTIACSSDQNPTPTVSLGNRIPPIARLGPTATEIVQLTTQLNFLDWYRLSREEQEAKVLSLKGQNVILNVDTADLRLHVVLENPDHVLIQFNVPVGKEPLPSAGPNYKGFPVEMRVAREQYGELKNSLAQDTATKDSRFPDLIVPKGTKISAIPDQLPRGTSQTEIGTQLVFQGLSS